MMAESKHNLNGWDMKSAFAFTLLVSVSAAMTLGCRRADTPPAPPPVVEYVEGPEFTFKTDESEVIVAPVEGTGTSSVELPKDVPIYQYAVVTLASRSPRGEFITYQANAGTSDVRAFYVEQLTDGGWELESQKNSNFTHELAVTQDERQLHVFIDLIKTDSGGATQVTVSHNSR